MGERSIFWNSTPEDKREYQAEDFAAVIAQLIGSSSDFTKNGTGVSKFNSTGPNGLLVSANSSNMTISLSSGFAFIAGKMYVNDSAKTLTHDAANASQPRIDRIVIRYDANTRTITSYIKKGNTAASPVPQALQNDAYIKEISVAQVLIIQGRSYITPSEITDERGNDAVCGYLPIHNIYRGVTVSPEGIVSMPNQSYVESTIYHASPYVTLKKYPEVGTLPIYTTTSGSNIFKDNQGEISIDHKFTPKASGTYAITVMVRFQDWTFPAGESADVQVFIRKNGVAGDESQAIIARRTDVSGDNIFHGFAIETLNAGDQIYLDFTHFGSPTTPKLLNQSIRIAKTN